MNKKFMTDEEGQGLIEYVLIIALISLIAIFALTLLGKKVDNAYINSSQLMTGT